MPEPQKILVVVVFLGGLGLALKMADTTRPSAAGRSPPKTASSALVNDYRSACTKSFKKEAACACFAQKLVDDLGTSYATNLLPRITGDSGKLADIGADEGYLISEKLRACGLEWSELD